MAFNPSISEAQQMRFHPRFAMALAASVLFAFTSTAQVTTRRAEFSSGGPGGGTGIYPQTPAILSAQSAVVVVGKVIEVEKDPVEVGQYRGAPKDLKAKYKVAVVKIDERLVGGSGLTQFRVGFPADSAPALPALPGRGPATLAAGQEGCFFLNPHFEGDFYVLASGGPLDKKAPNYTKEIAEIKKVAKILDDPVAALKAKELDDRFQAASVLLQRYRANFSGKPSSREPIPAEENKLILSLLQELPWQAKDGKPSRSALWYSIQPDLAGFKQPPLAKRQPGDPPPEFNKIMDEATSGYLKENIDKIKIRGFTK
jgi:hypothetical protein